MDYNHFEQWLINRLNLAETTARTYRNRIRQALEDLDFDPRNRTPEQVEQWVYDLEGSASNQNSWVGALRRFQDYCTDQLHMDADFANRLQMAKKPKRLPRPLALQDVLKIIEATPTDTLQNLRDRAILEVLYCGLRNEEVCESLLSNYRDREVRIVGKGDKERVVPLNDSAWDAVLRYAVAQHDGNITSCADREALEDAFTVLRVQKSQDDPTAFMFLSSEGNPLSPRRVREVVTKAARRAGIKSRVTPHMFRHSFATHVLDHGATDLIALMHVLGHTSLDMTRAYVKVSRAGRGRVNAYHPRQLGMKTVNTE